MDKNFKIFSGDSNPHLAQKICNHLDVPLGDVLKHTFPSGELFARFNENIRGEDVFIIQGAGDKSANDNFMQLMILADAARRASASRITAVMPMAFYSRQDRKNKGREPISFKLMLDMLNAGGVHRIVTMDLHSPQTQGFTNLPFDHLAFEPVLINYIKSHYTDLRNVILMAPDVGAVKRVEKYAHTLKCDFGFISKQRLGDERVECSSIVGNVSGKHVILIDDMTESADTLVKSAIFCKENKAVGVMAAVTHGCFTEVGMTKLSTNITAQHIGPKPIDEFVHSNTVYKNWSLKYKPANITELDVSKLFATAIYNIHNNNSVSELFVQ